MDKIKKFKKEVLTLKIYSQENYYSGNPFYIGKLEDERLKKSIEESSYKDFISKKNKKLYNEITSNEPISQYYVELVDEADLFAILEEALHSTDDFSIDDLKVALDLLEAYKYDSFLEELDLLQDKFLKVETTKKDEKCFKALCRKQFGYSIPKDGKITTVFVNSLQSEMKKRVDYLETLKDMIEKVIEIKESNETIASSKEVGIEFFPKNDPEIQSQIDCNIERKQVKPLFEFIDFLFFNQSEFIEYNSFVDEYERLKMKKGTYMLSNNYKHLIAMKELDHKIEAKKTLIHTNIAEPIIKKLQYLNVNNMFDYDTDTDLTIRHISGIDYQKKYCTSVAFELIKLYEDRYVEFREATKYNQYDCDELFEEVDNLLEDLFSFVHEDEVSNLKVSKEKYLDSIGALSAKPANNNLHYVLSKTNFKKEDGPETYRKNQTSLTPETEALFNFIDFLHSNIDNFNYYLDDVYDMDRELYSIDTSATHFEEVRENIDSQKMFVEKWEIVFKNIVTPIKEKVEELDVFNWYKPETLLKKHMPLVSRLSKNCKEQDSKLVLKAKKQYIQYTNEVSPYVTKLTYLMFKYLNMLMLVVAEDFEEDDDLSIYTEELREAKTTQECKEEILVKEERMFCVFLDSYDGGSENIQEQEIFELITELTKKNYIEKDDGFLIDGFTPKGIEYVKVIHFFREIYAKLYKELRFLFFNGKIELLRRIIILLQKGLRQLEIYDEDEDFFLEIGYEDGDIKFIRRTELRKHIFETKIHFVESLIVVLTRLIDTDTYEANFDQVSNAPALNEVENNKYAHYTALQWGAIIHYTQQKELELQRKTVDDILSDFKNKHNIQIKESTLRTRYYEAAKKIKNTFDYKSVLLEETIPFFNEHYKHLTGTIENEVKYLKEEEEIRLDNQ